MRHAVARRGRRRWRLKLSHEDWDLLRAMVSLAVTTEAVLGEERRALCAALEVEDTGGPEWPEDGGEVAP